MADDTTALLREYARGIKDVSEVSARYVQIQAAQAAGDKVLAASLTKTASATEKVALEMLRLNATLDDTTRESDAAKRAFAELGQKGQDTADKLADRRWKDIKENVQTVGKVAVLAAAGIAAVGAAMISGVANASAWNEELKAQGIHLQANDQALKANAASLDAATASLKAAAVSASGTFGPAVAYLADGVSILSLALADGYKKDLPEYAKEVERVKASLLDAGSAAKTAAENTSMWNAVLSKQKDEQKAAAEQEKALQSERIARDEERRTKAIANAKERVATANEASRQEMAFELALDAQVRTLETQQADRNRAAYASELAFEYELTQVVQAEEEKRAAAAKKTSDEAAALAERGRQSWSSSFASIGQSAGQLSDLLIKQSKKQGDAAEKAAIIAFRVQQASGIVGVAISTAQAIMMALGTLPPPASYVAAGAAALAGVAQAAVILAQPPPTSAGASGTTMPSAPSVPNTNTSAPSSQARTAGGGQSAAASGSTTGLAANANVQRAQDSQTMAVTDAYIPPTSRSRLVRIAAGDEANVNRAGALGRSARENPEQTALLREQNGLLRDLVASNLALQAQLLYRQHVASVPGPSGAQ